MRSRCSGQLRRAMVRYRREMQFWCITGSLRVNDGAPSGKYIDVSRVIPVLRSPLLVPPELKKLDGETETGY